MKVHVYLWSKHFPDYTRRIRAMGFYSFQAFKHAEELSLTPKG